MAPKAKSPIRPEVISTVRGGRRGQQYAVVGAAYRSPTGRGSGAGAGVGLRTGHVEDQSARQHECERAANGRRRVGVVLRLRVCMRTMGSVGTGVLAAG